jgi:hypothetical protein
MIKGDPQRRISFSFGVKENTIYKAMKFSLTGK